MAMWAWTFFLLAWACKGSSQTVIISRALLPDAVHDNNAYFVWQSNKAGLFSQYLQLKIAANFAFKKYKRLLLIAPIVSTHFYNGSRAINLCNILQLPREISCLSNISDLPYPPTLCRSTLNSSRLTLTSERYVCYNGSILALMTNNNMRDLMLKAVSLSFPYMSKTSAYLFPLSTIEFVEYFKMAMMTTSDARFIVVHWRRGDQLQTRCRRKEDQSVNCADAAVLVERIKVRLRSRDAESPASKVVYIATNEPSESTAYEVLHAAGFHTLLSVRQGIWNNSDIGGHSARPALLRALEDPVAIFSIEAAFMIEADQFIGWGISEVNDVVEFSRMKLGRSYCATKERRRKSKEEHISWCVYSRLQKRSQRQRETSKLVW